MRPFLAAVLALALIVSGCAPSESPKCPHPSEKASVKLVILGEHFNPSVIYWREAAERYFHEPVIMVVGHGGDYGDGVWRIQNQVTESFTPVYDVIGRLRAKYPGVRIVMICCNPSGIKCHMPGVSYALKSVWMFDDSLFEPGDGLDEWFGEDLAGSFEEFEHNGW